MEEDNVSGRVDQTMRYIGLRQPTSVPSGYQQTPAAPDAASSISRNGSWPTSGMVEVVAVPMGAAERPSDCSPLVVSQTTAFRRN